MKRKPIYFGFFLVILMIACGPSNEELLTRTREYMDQGDYSHALPLLDRLIENNSKNQMAYNMRGIARLELGQTDNAISDFDFCVVLDSNDYRAYYNRGNAYYQIERFKEAVYDYDKALRLEPKEPDVYINRGNALAQQEKYPDAIQDYSFALRLDEQNYLTHFNLGRTYYLIDSLELAKRYFENCLLIHDTYAPAYYFLGMIAIEHDNPELSCQMLKKAEDLGYEQAKKIINLYCEQN